MWQREMVPSSYFCVGTAEYQTEVELRLPAGKRVFLCFDGIAYKGKAWLQRLPAGGHAALRPLSLRRERLRP